jgi:hypothetical protein
MAFLGVETAADGAAAIGDKVDGASIGAKVEFIFIKEHNDGGTVSIRTVLAVCTLCNGFTTQHINLLKLTLLLNLRTDCENL